MIGDQEVDQRSSLKINVHNILPVIEDEFK